MHLRDVCSYFIIEINPKVSTQPKDNQKKSKGDSNNKWKIASQSGKYIFLVYFIKNNGLLKLLDNLLFLDIMDIICLYMI
jgi:hypothetical protein